MIRLPEPIKTYGKSKNNPVAFAVYSEAQLKQAVRDALMLAIQRLSVHTYSMTKEECIGAIRELIKEI